MSWTIVESGMYTAAASIMRLRPLLSKLPAWFKRTRTTEENGEVSWSDHRMKNRIGLDRYPGFSRQPMNHGHIPLGSFERGIDQGIVEV
jgi:hypothetical protein